MEEEDPISPCSQGKDEFKFFFSQITSSLV